MSEPLFSITLLNWNGGRAVERALDAVLRQPPDLFELIVVDNGSADGSYEKLARRVEGLRQSDYPGRLKLVTFARNTGYARAHNAAFAQARGRYHIVLNHDAFLAPDFLEIAARSVRENDAAMFAVKLYEGESGERLENVGLTFCLDGQNRGLGKGEIDRGQFDSKDEVFCPSGAVGIYRRDALEKVKEPAQFLGPSTCVFDPDYFAYGEDFELGLRLRRAGERCVLLADATARHLGSHSLGTHSRRRAHYIERNRLYTVMKHWPPARLPQVPRASLERFAAHLEKARAGRGGTGAFYAEHGPAGTALTLARADWDALQNAPKMLRKRAQLAWKFPLPEKKFSQWLDEFGTPPKEMAEGV